MGNPGIFDMGRVVVMAESKMLTIAGDRPRYDRAKSPFEGHPHPVSSAIGALELAERAVRHRWMSRCEDVDRLVEPVWMIPEDRMALPARRFAERVIRRNCHRLLGELR